MKLKMKNVALKVGDKLMIRGEIPHDAERFTFDLGSDSANLALHFDACFQCGSCESGGAVIVCNSMAGGCWGEEIQESKTCLKRGCDDVKIVVNFSCDGFEVKLPHEHTVRFPNRLALDVVTLVVISGGFKLKCLKINKGDVAPEPPRETSPEGHAEEDEGTEGPPEVYCIITLETAKLPK